RTGLLQAGSNDPNKYLSCRRLTLPRCESVWPDNRSRSDSRHFGRAVGALKAGWQYRRPSDVAMQTSPTYHIAGCASRLRHSLSVSVSVVATSYIGLGGLEAQGPSFFQQRTRSILYPNMSGSHPCLMCYATAVAAADDEDD
ncbi:hypothetical protein Vretifemale_13897, partial [Volvox reticuliferus]